jgi:hypothetical protein
MPSSARARLRAAGIVGDGLPRDLEVSVFRSPSSGAVFVDLASLGENEVVHLSLRGVGDLGPGLLRSPARPGARAVHVRGVGDRTLVGPLQVTDYATVKLTPRATTGQ